MPENNDKSTLLAFMLGGIIGGALGVLFAPHSGKETRRRVANAMGELEEKGMDILEKAKDKIEKVYEEGKEKILDEKERIGKAIDAGKDAYHQNPK